MRHTKEPIDPDRLWEQLLSRHKEEIRNAFFSLSKEERIAVKIHLHRMASESGWHPDQRISAQEALQAIKEETDHSG